MKDKSNIIKVKTYIPYILFFGFMVFLHVKGYKLVYDDIIVSDGQKDTFIEQLKMLRSTYKDWSSRVLINPLIWIVYRFGKIVWIILDSLIFTLIFKGINYLCFNEQNIRNTYILMLLMLQFPLDIVTTAGWVVTTITYLWPAAAAVWACCSIRYYLDDEKVSVPKFILFVLLTIFATNKEEVSVMLFIIFGTLIVISLNNKKISFICVLQFVFSFGSLLFHLMYQGNQTRSNTYSIDLTTIDKLEIGFSSTFFHMFIDFDTFTAGFCLMLALMLTVSADKLLKKIIGWIPFFVWVLACFGEEKQLWGLYVREDYRDPVYPADYLTNGKYLSFAAWGQLLLFVLVVTVIIASVICINKISVETIILIAVLTGGYCGRMVVGFGEHGWLPYSRTYTFFYFGMIVILYILLDKVIDRLQGKKKEAFIYMIIGVTILELFINIITLGIVDIGV